MKNGEIFYSCFTYTVLSKNMFNKNITKIKEKKTFTKRLDDKFCLPFKALNIQKKTRKCSKDIDDDK